MNDSTNSFQKPFSEEPRAPGTDPAPAKAWAGQWLLRFGLLAVQARRPFAFIPGRGSLVTVRLFQIVSGSYK